MFYKTNITIGDPPQLFNVAVDTSADNLFVPSATCLYDVCDPRQKSHPYNNTLSSTYKPEGGLARSNWAAVNYDGLWSRDNVHIGDLNVTDHVFEEWQSASCVSFGCVPVGYDGALGLSPPWKSWRLEKPNVLSTLLSQKSLDASIFSLKLPIEEYGEGELLFGATNPKLNSSSFVNLPVVNMTSSPYFADSWTVSVEHISFASPHTLHLSLPSPAYALLDSALPYLILPTELARNMTAAIGAQPGPYWFYNIPCERRQELPLLTFTLDGHNFSISAFEYTIEMDDPIPHMGRICITMFMESGDFGLGNDGNFIMLGNSFLRGFYSSWNFEEKEVGCKSIHDCYSEKTERLIGDPSGKIGVGQVCRKRMEMWRRHDCSEHKCTFDIVPARTDLYHYSLIQKGHN